MKSDQQIINIFLSMQFDHLYHPLHITREAYYTKMRRNLSGQIVGNYLIDKQPKEKLKRDKYKLSRVFTANNIHDSTKVAIKVIDIDKTRDQDSKTYQKYLNFLRKESDLMMEGHRHILKCHEVYQNDFLKIMVLDYCEYNLEQKIQQEKIIRQQEEKRRLEDKKKQNEIRELQLKSREQKGRQQERRRQLLKKKQEEWRRWQQYMKSLSQVDRKIMAFYKKHDPQNQTKQPRKPQIQKSVTFVNQICLEQKRKEQQLMKKRDEEKKDSSSFEFLYQVLQGLEVLHSRNIVHSDLKTTGILYHEGRYLISDIGTNSEVSNSTEFALKCLSKNWRKRSIKDRRMTEPKHQREPNYKSDIWQLGAILFNVTFHKNIICQPVFTMSSQSFSSLNNRLSYMGRTPCESLSVLIKIMLAEKEEDRPSCSTLLKKLKLNQSNNFTRGFSIRQYERFKQPKLVPHYYFSEYKNINDHKTYVQKCRLYAQAQFLQSELLTAGLKQRVFNIHDRLTIEFLHLLSIRILNDYAPLKAFLKQKHIYDAEFSQMASACIEDQKRIKLKQDIFSRFFLEERRNLYKYTVSTIDTQWEGNSRVYFDQDEKCEGRNYSRNQQIKFMLNYVPEVIYSLNQVGEARRRVVKILKFLTKLFELEEKDFKMHSVKEYIEKQLRLFY